MKHILLLLLTLNIAKANDTIPFPKEDTIIYPIKISLNGVELICFTSPQGTKIYNTWQDLQNCQRTVQGRDSLLASVKLENSKLYNIVENDNIIRDADAKKLELYEKIVLEKDKQLGLSKRESVVNTLSNKGNVINTALFAFLTGCLVGYLVHK